MRAKNTLKLLFHCEFVPIYWLSLLSKGTSRKVKREDNKCLLYKMPLEMSALPRRIKSNTKGNKGGYDGFLYEDKVFIFIAVCLSTNKDFKDFWMVSNPKGIGSWDDIVLHTTRVTNEQIACLVQVKHTKNPLHLLEQPKNKEKTGQGTKTKTTQRTESKEDNKKTKSSQTIDIGKYKTDFENFLNKKPCNELHEEFQCVDKDNHYCCIFSNTNDIQPEVNARVPIGHPVLFMNATEHDECRIFKTDKMFIYLLLNQPDKDTIDFTLHSKLGEPNINIRDLIDTFYKYSYNEEKNECVALTRKKFEMIHLESVVKEYMIVDFPQVEEIDELQLWIDIYTEKQIINVDNYDKICPLLGYFLQQQIQRLTDTAFTWKAGLTDEIKEKIFDKYRNNVHVIYNELRVTNIKELLILLWKLENIPLIIKPKHALNMVNILNEYKHLGKNNFIIFSGGKIYDNVIYNVGQISRASTLKKILEIELSIQGRPRLPLSDIAFIRSDQESSAFLRTTSESPVLQNITISQLLQWTAKGNDRTIGQIIREQNRYYMDRRFCDVTTEKQLTEEEMEDAMENGAKLFTIWGEPGMGKSEVLRSLAYKYSCRKMVVFVEIRPNFDFDDGAGFDLIKKCLDTKSDVLFNSIYDTHKKNNNIVLFVDNYDYIPQKCKDTMEEDLHTILEENNSPIFVTTKSEIEFPKIDQTNKITLNLLPLSDDDLDQYCKHHEMPIYEDNAVLKQFDKSFWKRPLLLTMITNLFNSDNCRGINLQKSEICEKFVHQILTNYCQNRNIEPSCIIDYASEYHEELALMELFTPDYVFKNKLIRRCKLPGIENYTKDKGLVKCTNAGLQFIDVSFTEYFVQRRLDKFKTEDEYEDMLMLFENWKLDK